MDCDRCSSVLHNMMRSCSTHSIVRPNCLWSSRRASEFALTREFETWTSQRNYLFDLSDRLCDHKRLWIDGKTCHILACVGLFGSLWKSKRHNCSKWQRKRWKSTSKNRKDRCYEPHGRFEYDKYQSGSFDQQGKSTEGFWKESCSNSCWFLFGWLLFADHSAKK